jgi:hypothetical protein
MFKEFILKKFIKLIGFIAIVAVIGFSMTACGGDDSGDATEIEAKTGRLLLTGFPDECNGNYVILPVLKTIEGIRLSGFQSYDGNTTTWTKISNGKANVPIWTVKGYIVEEYYGNDTINDLGTQRVSIVKEPTNAGTAGDDYTEVNAVFITGPIVFVNGYAEKSLIDGWWQK